MLDIFRRYLALGNVRLLKQELDRRGLRNKARVLGGQVRTAAFSRGGLYKLLGNRIYVGEIGHKGQVHPGLQKPIVDKPLWTAVQAKLEQGAVREGPRKTAPSPLMGKLVDETGECLTPTHSSKDGRRLRYYVSRSIIHGDANGSRGWRLPALEIERTVAVAASRVLRDRKALVSAFAEVGDKAGLTEAARAAGEAADRLARGDYSLLPTLVDRVGMKADGVEVGVILPIEGAALRLKGFYPIQMQRRGVELRMVTEGAVEAQPRIDPALLSKPAVVVANKLPKSDDPCGLVTYGARGVSNENQFVGRVDYQHTEKDSLFGRVLFTKYHKPNAYALTPNLLLTQQSTDNLGFDDLAQSYTLGDTYLISPNTINSFRLAVNRTAIDRVPAQFFTGTDIGVNIYSYDPKQIQFVISGDFTIGGGYGPGRNTSYAANDDVSLIHGTHQMAFGMNLAHWRNHLLSVTNASIGGFTFNGQTTGSPLADFLIGSVGSFQEKSAHETYMSQWYVGAYAADTWRATPRLTVSYGIRWEPFLPPVSRNGVLANFDEARYAAATKSMIFKNAPAGFYYPGDPGFPGTSCRSNGVCNATGMYSRLGEVTPRLGFAWDVMGDGRTSLRAGYGMAHDMLAGGFFNNLISAPWDATIQLGSVPSFENPWQGYPGGNPFPTKLVDPNAAFPAFGGYLTVPYDAPPMTRHSWNLSIQRQIGTDWLVSSSYMGSRALHLWGNQELNPATFIPGTCQAGQIGLTAPGPCSTTGNVQNRRKYSLLGTPIGPLDRYTPGGTESYHGMLLSVQRRAAHGVTVGANYTWSHCYGNSSRASAAGTPGNTYLDPYNRDFDRGNCESDRRHLFNMTAVAETPRFSNNTLRMVGTGWRLSGIYRKSTGSWLTILSGVDRALTGVSNQRAQQVLQNPYGNKSLTNFLNPAAFAPPALGSLGNMRPGNIEGPGSWQLDVSMSRSFQLRENQRIEARVEAYNLTNSMRPMNPTVSLNSNTFGQIITAYDPRLLQFALKYAF